MADWLRFATDGLGLIVGRAALVAAPDARTTKCGVFTQADVTHAMTTYGFPAEAVSVVGNPDLIHFGMSERLLGSFTLSPPDSPRYLMYINTGSLVSARVFSGERAFLSHMIDTSEVLGRQGYRLRFKPHHDTPSRLVGEIARSAGAVIVSDQEFVPFLQSCCGCISETTTLALVPALMGLPLLLANYAALSKTKFGEVLLSYPRVAILQDLGMASVLLSQLSAGDDGEDLRQWIERNSGPLPADEMGARVASLVGTLSRSEAFVQVSGATEPGAS